MTRTGLSVVPARIWVALAIMLIPAVVGYAVVNGLLPLLGLASIALWGVVGSMSRPLPFLLLYVGLIPIEALLVLGDAATLARAVGAAFVAGYLLRRIGSIQLGALPAFGWAFLAWAALSSFWAIDPATTLEQLLTLGQLVIMTVAIADLVSRRPDDTRTILSVYAASAVVVATLAIADFAIGGGAGSERASAIGAQGPAHLAAVLLPAFFYLVFAVIEGRHRGLAALALLVVVGAILLSGTRSAWLALAMVAVIAVPRFGARTMLPGAILVAAMVLLLQVPEIGAMFDGRVSSALETGGAGRVDIWSVGLSIFAGSPIIGVGYDNFPLAFTPEVIRSAEVPGLNLGILDAGLAPHSILIGTLAELGLIGFVLLAGFLVQTLLLPTGNAWGPALKLMLGALLSQALFLDLLNRKQVWLIIALIVGLAAAAASERRGHHAQEKAARQEVADRLRRTWEARR